MYELKLGLLSIAQISNYCAKVISSLHISKLFVLFFGLKCYKVFIDEDANSRTEIFNNNCHFFSEKFCSLLLFVYLCRVFTKRRIWKLIADPYTY